MSLNNIHDEPRVSQTLDQQARRCTAVKLRKKTLVDYLVQLRWIAVIFVVLPVSLILDIISFVKQQRSACKPYKQRQLEHHHNVANVIRRLQQRHPTRDGLVCTARKPYVTVGIRNMDYKRARRFEVDLSAFNNVLNIDSTQLIAHVEPLVTMGQITRLTLPMNLSLAVVPELNDLTVGGLINGFGIEGNSHIYGLFSDTIVSYEIVLAGGKLVKATADNEYADLFYAIPWSQGTLGLVVAAEIKLIHVREYMRVRYLPVRGTLRELADAYISSFTVAEDIAPDEIRMEAHMNGHHTEPTMPEFVETIIFSPTEAVCMTGQYASAREAKESSNHINRQGWWFKPWFYQHAQTALKRGEFVEYIPTRDYYHRHTKSFFWEGKLILPFADQAWFRWLLGWLMPPKIPLLKITEAPAIRDYYQENHVLQDLLVPLYKVPAALEFAHQELELYPIWLCPHKLFKHPVTTMLHPEPGFENHKRRGDTPNAQMYTDIGFYYTPAAILHGEEFDGIAACHRIEQWLIGNHGYQALYAVTELSEKDFWRMFDGSLYAKCRRKYKAVGTFMSVYYKSKKGRKTEKEVQEEEQKLVDTTLSAEWLDQWDTHKN